MRSLLCVLALVLAVPACDGEVYVDELCDEAEEKGCVQLDAADSSQVACKAAYDRARSAHVEGCQDAFDQLLECLAEEVDNAPACLNQAQLDAACSGQVQALASCDRTYAER